MMDNYKLDGTEPVKCDDVLEWAKWFETATIVMRDWQRGTMTDIERGLYDI